MGGHAEAASRLQTQSIWLQRITDVNRELWLLLSLFVIAGLLKGLVASQGVILGLYTTLPRCFQRTSTGAAMRC